MKATNNIRSRMVTLAEVLGAGPPEGPWVVWGLLAPFGAWFLAPRFVLEKILVNVVVGLSRLAVTVAVGAEFADGVRHGPALILHAVHGGQGTRAVQSGHAVDE